MILYIHIIFIGKRHAHIMTAADSKAGAVFILKNAAVAISALEGLIEV